jgi:amidase
MSTDWQARCVARKKKQFDSIPPAWIINAPPDDLLNVLDVPRNCGLLTSRELLITETIDVEIMLRKLSSAEWSSVEVTTAFYKRAIIAQQLVRVFQLFVLSLANLTLV